MATIEELLSDLHHLDIKLWLEGQRLRYNAPKGALTPELRDRLVERKAEIISFLQQTNAGVANPVIPLQPIPRTDNPPLSFAQERIWFLECFGRKKGSYNMPLAQRLTGNFDVAVFKRAIAEMIRRHEALRTTFERVKFSAVQVIRPTFAIDVPVIDLQEIAEPKQSVEVQRLMVEEIQRPFNLEKGPLLRVLLLRLAPQEHILLLVTHHIISDAWSEGILMKELSLLYPAFQTGKPSPLPELSIQYADFACWQRQ
ncbi:MAG: condensation domain-containing protein, partial [Cyanobacteriota bacterium]|nr:condensation domain-containing protein [Cyanobacteriota bacterium]